MTLPDKKPAGTFTTWLRRRKRLRKEVLEARNTGDITHISASVPCGACCACCYHYEVGFDQRFDNPSEYETEIGRTGVLVLKHQEDGTCIYLKYGQCFIYDRRPYYCRVYDCRPLAYANITVTDRPDLNAAIQQWDERGFCKTKQDLIELSAYQLAVRNGVLMGESADDVCLKSLDRIDALKAMAEKIYNELRSKP